MAFLTTLMVAAALLWLYAQLKPNTSLPVYAQRDGLREVSGIAFFFLLYWGMHLEIRNAWPALSANQPWLLEKGFADITIIAFTSIYAVIWQYLNSRHLKNSKLQIILYVFAAFTAAVYLTTGFTRLGEIREAYLAGGAGPAWLKLGIRYPLTLLMGTMVWGMKKGMDIFPEKARSSRILSIGFNALLLGFLCNEFIHWMDVLGFASQYKLGLSIIAGLYALVLIVIGLLKNRKHDRISGMSLMGITLIKILFYDMANMGNISRTMVLIVMGLILLMASYMYNKHIAKMKN
jgi:uncharacterized membrane protein